MTRSLALSLALLLVATGCSQSDDRGESGRTRSLASVGSGAQALGLSLAIRRTRDATGAETFSATVEKRSYDPLPTTLVLPDDQPVELTLSGGTASATLNELPPAGAYRFRNAQGALLTTVVSLGGEPPPYPELAAPRDQALFLPGDRVEWTWSGSAGLFDLEVFDGAGTSIYAAHDLPGFEATIAELKSGPAQLELRATSGSSAARARWESGARVMISVGSK